MQPPKLAGERTHSHLDVLQPFWSHPVTLETRFPFHWDGSQWDNAANLVLSTPNKITQRLSVSDGVHPLPSYRLASGMEGHILLTVAQKKWINGAKNTSLFFLNQLFFRCSHHHVLIICPLSEMEDTLWTYFCVYYLLQCDQRG